MAIIRFVHFFTFITFIAIKVGGTAFAAWSWFWLLMPAAPVFYLLLSRLGVA